MNIGPMIRQIRKSSGMSQTRLAEKIGLSYQQVQKYEYGKSEITVKRLRQVADALDVPPGMFMEGAPADADELKVLMLYRESRNKRLGNMAVEILKVIAGQSQTVL